MEQMHTDETPENEELELVLSCSQWEYEEMEARRKLTEEYEARIKLMPFDEWLNEWISKQRRLEGATQVLSFNMSIVEGKLDNDPSEEIFLLELQIEALQRVRPDHYATYTKMMQTQRQLAQASVSTKDRELPEKDNNNVATSYITSNQFNDVEEEFRRSKSSESNNMKQITGVPTFVMPRLDNEEEPTIHTHLGRGKSGHVFLGFWKGARVAIKVLPHTTDEEALLREVGSLYTLRHPNVVSFFHYMKGNLGHYIITEYVSGGSLRSKLDDPSFTFSNKLKVQMLIDIAAAMYFAHEHNVIHRDLRCENLLLMPDCRFSFTVKVADFGLARVAGAGMTRFIGAFGWIPDEVLEANDYDLSFDVFSFGVVIYEILTRRRPESTKESPYFRILSPMPEDTPLKLWELMTLCLLKEKERRPKFAQILKILFNIQAQL